VRKRIVYLAAMLIAIAVFAVIAIYTSSGHTVSGDQAESPSAPVPGTSPAPPPLGPPDVGIGWTLAFDGTFPGSTLNTSVWDTCYPWATTYGCTNFGTGDDYEWYLPSQVQVFGDSLHLVAQRVPTPGYNRAGIPKEYSCRSGMVTTYPGFHFQYGYIQITAHVPLGTELWPALWLLAVNEHWPPEIDILERWGFEKVSAVFLHPTQGARQGGAVDTPNIFVGWHTFSLYWTRTKLIWYIDGREVFSTTSVVPQQPMYFVADLADSVPPNAHPAADDCSGSLLIRSVKVWEPTH
jgi:beta-glucanase (GH16 family)